MAFAVGAVLRFPDSEFPLSHTFYRVGGGVLVTPAPGTAMVMGIFLSYYLLLVDGVFVTENTGHMGIWDEL